MANHVLEADETTSAGVAASAATKLAAKDTLEVDNLRALVLRVHVPGAAAASLEFTTPALSGEHGAETHTVAVGAESTAYVGPFHPTEFGSPIKAEASVEVEVEVVSLPLRNDPRVFD